MNEPTNDVGQSGATAAARQPNGRRANNRRTASGLPVRHRGWRSTIAVVVVGSALAAAGCSATSEETATDPGTPEVTTPAGIEIRNIPDDEGEPVDGGKLVFGIEAETESGLNPITGQFAASGHFMASSVFDPLATLDENGESVPYLATSIEPNVDFTEWTITLREGVLFHDDTPLDAEAVKATLEGHRTSLVTKDAVRSIAEVEVIDPLTLVVRMSQPWAQFPYALTTQVGYIPAPSMLADPEGPFKPVGTGPYVFTSWDIGESFEATKNEDYWQEGKPYLSGIEFRPIPDAQARAEGVVTGELDMIHTVTPRDIQFLREKDVKMIEVSTGEETSIALNAAVAPFDDPIARQAVAAATDVDRLLSETKGGLADPARGVFVPGQLGHRSESNAATYDLDRAKALTAEYAAKVGQPLTFVYKGADTIDDRASQQLLEQMWEEAGMQVELQSVPQSEQIINTVLGTYQATDWRNFGSPDPDGDYVWWHSTSVNEGGISLNVPRLGDPELDGYLDQARATVDPAVRDELYAKVSERLNVGLGYIWLERPVWALAAEPRVNGFLIAQNGSISTVGSKTWVADLWITP